MRFKKRPQLPGAGRTRACHHHGSDTPTYPRAISLYSSLYPGGYKIVRHTVNITLTRNFDSQFVFAAMYQEIDEKDFG